MITQLKLDESTKLEFGVSVTGADSKPTARFIIEGKDFSIMLPCRNVNEQTEVEIPALKHILPAGEYPVRLEVVIDNKIYTPMEEQIRFEPCIEIATKTKPIQAVKESVKVAKVTVKKATINEAVLRKTQAATIIAQSLGYSPAENESPEDIIEHAIHDAGEMSAETALVVEEMLKLAESVGIDVICQPKVKLVVLEEKKQQPKDEDDLSDEELDDMISGLDHEDILSTYDDSEFGVYDEHGNLIEEDIQEESALNEILSRTERLKSRIRMAKNKQKLQAKLKIALHKHSSGSTLNHRARRLAVKAMEKKLARKPLEQLSASEKERIERVIQRRKKAIDRMAMKLIPHVRQVEKERLAR